MKSLDTDLINESSMCIIGNFQIHGIGELSPANPIKAYYSAFDRFQVKVADVLVSIYLNPIKASMKSCKNNHAQLNSILNKKEKYLENQAFLTPASLDNITNFNTKYNSFEN